MHIVHAGDASSCSHTDSRRRTSASFSSSRRPARTTSPRSITTMVWASSWAKSKYCSTSRMAIWPCDRSSAMTRSQGQMAILLVEQYFDFAQELAQTIVVMDRGDVVLAGRREELNEADVRRRLSV